uniref:RdRp n=1 Tax=viral metagenome TaxID=1070528 RepID=A0A2V0RCH9_9ZZZZ
MNIPSFVKTRLSHRYESIRNIVSHGKASIRSNPDSTFVDVSTDGNAQWTKMTSIIDFFMLHVSDIEETIEDSTTTMLKRWCECDRDASNVNPTASDFFPTLIRGVEKKSNGVRVADEFPVLERPAVVTRSGADLLMQNSRDGRIGDYEINDLKDAFITNIGRPEVKLQGQTIELHGLTMNLSPVDLRADAQLSPEYHVSYTESWQKRWSEARRYTPFYLTSNYLTWLLILQAAETPWSDCLRKGVNCLYVGTVYLALEWLATHCPNVERANKHVSTTSMLRAWKNQDETFRIPNWVHVWRAPMQYSYVKASDVGYKLPSDVGIMQWSAGVLSKQVGSVNIEETPMPFVEKADMGYPLQSSALTTMSPLRFFLCFSLCIETCCSNHLTGFHDYYEDVLGYLGCNPGRVGRKLAKTVVKFSRLVGSDVRLRVPTVKLNEADDVTAPPYDPPTVLVRINDTLARSAIAQNVLGKEKRNASKRDILTGIISEIPSLERGLTGIFNEYCVNGESGDEEVPPKHTISNFNKAILDVITHTASAGSAEGYSRSCLGSLPVAGYTSYMQRLVMEGIDSNAKRDVDDLEYDKYTTVLSRMSVPTMSEFFLEAKEIAIAKSAAGDKVKFDITEGEALGTSESSRKEKAVASRKDVLFLNSALMINKEYMMLRSTFERAFLTGLRSVPARKLRYIYMLPIPHQLVIFRLYNAFKEFQKNEPGYALAQKAGIPVFDARLEINSSIELARDDSLFCYPADASSLDQHMGVGHRAVLIQAIKDCGILDEIHGDSEMYQAFGYTYKEAMLNALENWDDSYYRSPVPGAPDQLIKVDSQPSGALTTAVVNSHVTDCMMLHVQRKLGFRFAQQQLWGDDFYGVTSRKEGVHTLDYIQEMDDVCLEAGQNMGTVKDSTLGRGVHFLQKYYLGGQEIRRRVAYDHESEVANKTLTGDISSYLTKVKMMTSRGGNADGLNMLQMLTIINGSRSTQFGRQARVDFDSMAAAGGFTNQIMVGFSSDNSRLFLELNSELLFGQDQVEILQRPQFEQPIDTGKRVLSRHQDTLAKVNIGGATGYHTIGTLLETSEVKLLDKTRLTSTLPATVGEFFDLDYVREISYAGSVRGAAAKAVGESLQTRSLKPKFIEKALIANGLIGSSLRETPEPKTKLSSTHLGFRYLGKRILYGYSDKFYMKLPSGMHEGENMFELHSVLGQVPLSFNQKWHPYYAMPENFRLMCSLFGVTTARRSAFDVKSHTSMFSPDKFRKDINKDAVIAIVEKTRHDQQTRHAMLSNIGFTPFEIGMMDGQLINLDAMKDVETASEYSSIPEIMKCLSTRELDIIMSHVSPQFMHGYFANAPVSLKTLVHTHFLSLIADEMNIAIALGGDRGSSNRYIRMPTVSFIES